MAGGLGESPAQPTCSEQSWSCSSHRQARSPCHSRRISSRVANSSSSFPAASTLLSLSTTMQSARRRATRRCDTARQVASRRLKSLFHPRAGATPGPLSWSAGGAASRQLHRCGHRAQAGGTLVGAPSPPGEGADSLERPCHDPAPIPGQTCFRSAALSLTPPQGRIPADCPRCG